ncbi:MAG: circularly permuted type 2 ATP-grasp protein, partial [bacterium]|nr:circularly permuted type 2 ATP-grasp protein [bacterium]
MNFDSYDLDPAVFDEMFGADGSPHPHCEDLHDTLGSMSSADLSAIGEWVTRSFTNEGITFTVYG